MYNSSTSDSVNVSRLNKSTWDVSAGETRKMRATAALLVDFLSGKRHEFRVGTSDLYNYILRWLQQTGHGTLLFVQGHQWLWSMSTCSTCSAKRPTIAGKICPSSFRWYSHVKHIQSWEDHCTNTAITIILGSVLFSESSKNSVSYPLATPKCRNLGFSFWQPLCQGLKKASATHGAQKIWVRLGDLSQDSL